MTEPRCEKAFDLFRTQSSFCRVAVREYIREAEAVRVPGAEAALSAKLEVVIHCYLC